MTAAVATLGPVRDGGLIQSLMSDIQLGETTPNPPSARSVCAGLLAAGLSAALWFLPQTLAVEGRLALIVVVLAVIGWTLTRVPDSLVAIAGALLMVGLGVLQAEDLYASLGSEMIWLLLAAFVMAAVLKASGLLERLVFAAIRPFASIGSLFYGLALVIAFTAFLVPSTSGRAALLLPVFLVLAERMPDPRLVRPLALLFPTVILLSAGGSLIGAGAHFVAVDTISRSTGQAFGYLDWLALAFPFALLSSLAGVWLILRLFVPAGLARKAVAPNREAGMPLGGRQKAIALVLAAVVIAWMTIPLHGLDVALVAIAGAAVLLSKAFTGLKPKDVFRQVEVELLVFLAATVVIAEGMTASGADRWLAEGALAALPASMTGSLAMVVAVTALVALTAHLVITSRSARAAVLIPAFALPIAGLGHDVTLLILVTVLGTGFCQTMMASAKPVAVFGTLERETFTQSDLLRLAAPLLPIVFGLLVGFALLVWPHQLGGSGGDAVPVPTSMETIAAAPCHSNAGCAWVSALGRG